MFQTLREKLRCKEIWVVGAGKWRDPDLDLPKDFEASRAENYARLRKPLNPKTFIGDLREEMETELSALNEDLPGLDWVEIKEGRKNGAIVLTPLDKAPEPRNLRRLKNAVTTRWGTVPLLDMLTEAALRTRCLDAFTPIGPRSDIPPGVLLERLLLLVYAYGTNTGIRAVAAGEHRHTEDDLRYVRRRYITVESCRMVARVIANAMFAARSHRRIAVLASACALVAAGALAFIGTASAGAAASATSGTTSSCSDATLHGTYTFGYIGFSVSKGVSTPESAAGFDRFNGAGASTGVITFVGNGVVENNNTPDTSTYTINADCTGTIVFNTAGSLAHFNVYVSPSGKSFSLVETDPGSVVGATETRVTQ